MGIFDDIGNAFKSAGEAIADVGKDVGNKIANAGEDAFDFTKKVAQSGALALADGANMFGHGWQEVFSGHFQSGLAKIAMGMGEAIGLLPPTIIKQYEQAVGEASLWALLESKKTNKQVCFSAYRSQVQANVGRQGLQWSGDMEKSLRDGLDQMPWINPGC